MPILLGAEMPFRIHWLATLRAAWPTAIYHLGAVLRESPALLAGECKPRGVQLLAFFPAAKLLGDDHQHVARFIIAQADLADPERLFDRLLELHARGDDQIVGGAQERVFLRQAL